MFHSHIAHAYDTIALKYDLLLEENFALRRVLWRYYRNSFKQGQYILDAGCGTGIDTLFLAKQGIYVTGIDISPGMIKQLQHKVSKENLSYYINTEIIDICNLDKNNYRKFNGIISGFASLNTIVDLNVFSDIANKLLCHDGRMIICLLNNSFNPKYIKNTNDKSIYKTNSLCGHIDIICKVGDLPVKHYLYNYDEIYEDYFSRHFNLLGIYGLGIIKKLKLGDSVSYNLEFLLGKFTSLIKWSSFFILELQKRI